MAQPTWNTTAGTIGVFPSLIPISFQLSASAVLPAVTVTYTLLSGNLPNGLSLNEDGLIYGTPSIISSDTSFVFVVRATDNYSNIRDRTFSITITGAAGPSFTTPTGSILSTIDSIWVELPIAYSNPVSSNPVTIRLIQGILPPGLEINEAGLIRGYAEPPTTTVNLPSVITSITDTSATDNTITCFSTAGFSIGRPIVFSGTPIGNIVSGQTYYIKNVINSTLFTISTEENGPTYILSTGTGSMTTILPSITYGQPTIRAYSFTLEILSPLGNDIESYSITVINQNTPSSQGGPGLPPNSRQPVLYNTRPPTYNIESDTANYGYYVLPPDNSLGIGVTYPITTPAYIGKIASDNYFAFKILGNDFDGNNIEYLYAGLPLGLVGDINTGWITGNPVIADDSLSEFTFSVAVRKTSNPSIISPFFNFSFKVANGIDGNITWITNGDLGQIFNGTISTKSVVARSDVTLFYRLTSGALPPNLTLLNNGEITGSVAYQPTDTFLNPNVVTPFTFTIEAYSPSYSVIKSSKTFTMSVLQEYNQPTDNLYIKCTPSIENRNILRELLDNDAIIPTDSLYRAEDPNFGKASSVVYAHAYGIYASNFDEYIAAVTKNHYWRYLTLGSLETAVARNENGEIVYEVVYSKVIDNLINPQGISISEEIYWPRLIDLNQGPWYTSSTNIYTSWVWNSSLGNPTFYTSLTPGYARILYPNSLPNMRDRVGQVLGQEYDFRLLPLWMTSQQLNGSTLGFVPAWVICYTKPGQAETVKNNIETLWVDPIGRPYTLNTINFEIDRFTVDKSTTYNYDKNVSPPAWTNLPSGSPAPNPIDSENFYVLFPRKTILPDDPQYY